MSNIRLSEFFYLHKKILTWNSLKTSPACAVHLLSLRDMGWHSSLIIRTQQCKSALHYLWCSSSESIPNQSVPTQGLEIFNRNEKREPWGGGWICKERAWISGMVKNDNPWLIFPYNCCRVSDEGMKFVRRPARGSPKILRGCVHVRLSSLAMSAFTTPQVQRSASWLWIWIWNFISF